MHLSSSIHFLILHLQLYEVNNMCQIKNHEQVTSKFMNHQFSSQYSMSVKLCKRKISELQKSMFLKRKKNIFGYIYLFEIYNHAFFLFNSIWSIFKTTWWTKIYIIFSHLLKLARNGINSKMMSFLSHSVCLPFLKNCYFKICVLKGKKAIGAHLLFFQ